jgi:hypothetical protein
VQAASREMRRDRSIIHFSILDRSVADRHEEDLTQLAMFRA